MKEIIQSVISWSFPVVGLILIVIAATRKRLKGRPWLLTYLFGSLLISIVWRMPGLLVSLNILDEGSLSTFYNWFPLPLNVIELILFCLLVPYVLSASSGRELVSGDMLERTMPAREGVDPRLVGIGGWLVLPAIGLILAPIIEVVSLIIAIGLFEDVSDAGYGGIFLFNIIVEFGLLILIVYAAICFFGKKAITPTVMITLYVVQVIASGVCLVLALMAEAESFAIEDGKALFRGLIGAAIWIPYFSVSKRVKATFVN